MGAKKLEKALAKAAEAGSEAVVEGLQVAASDILEDARVHAPVETGRLRASGRVVDTDNGADVVFDAPYAVVVHERAGGKGFKFLERALLENVKQVAGEAAKCVEKGLKR